MSLSLKKLRMIAHMPRVTFRTCSFGHFYKALYTYVFHTTPLLDFEPLEWKTSSKSSDFFERGNLIYYLDFLNFMNLKFFAIFALKKMRLWNTFSSIAFNGISSLRIRSKPRLYSRVHDRDLWKRAVERVFLSTLPTYQYTDTQW